MLLLLLGDVLACDQRKHKARHVPLYLHPCNLRAFRANRELTTPALTHTDAGKICF